MSKLVRLSDGTYQRVGIKPGESLGVVPNPQMEQPAPGTIECALCGARAELTDEVTDSWYPDVWAIYIGGDEKEIGIVCNAHDVLYDKESGTYQVNLQASG